MSDILLSGLDITHHIHQRPILDKVSLTMSRGDFITIVGPNGAGKSTLIKVLTGLITPDQGQVMRGQGVKIGYVPQKMNSEASLPLNARRFITLNQPSLARFDEVVADNGIAPLLDKQMRHLSGGEWQRVLLARALMDEVDAIILDEPAQNLDLTGQMQFYQRLDAIHQTRGIAILMVSHDLHMVMASTKQVVCLYHHICCSGAPQAVTKDPEFEKLFGQDMAAMMAIYHHQHDAHHDHHHHHDHVCDHHTSHGEG